ncbi:hypothetical protein [Bacillus subtilis]|uniref:hypothetical protein n=1 Tax=Bacillus subtilis TaxID=1423 RepID=UPI0005B32063|nr:hypothetical protein [Bacillus subtilis]
MLNMLGSVHRTNSNLEDDKKSMRILKSHRRTIFALIILIMVINISDYITKEMTFLMGLFTGMIGVMCIGGLIINIKLSKRIGTRIKKNLG